MQNAMNVECNIYAKLMKKQKEEYHFLISTVCCGILFNIPNKLQ